MLGTLIVPEAMGVGNAYGHPHIVPCMGQALLLRHRSNTHRAAQISLPFAPYSFGRAHHEYFCRLHFALCDVKQEAFGPLPPCAL